MLFVPIMHKLQNALPPQRGARYLPGVVQSERGLPMFQLAYLTAQSLGVADQFGTMPCLDAVGPPAN